MNSLFNQELSHRSSFIGWVAILAALFFTCAIILLSGSSPVAVFHSIIIGAFATPDRFARVFTTLVPLLLCGCGLMFTFTAGLYNLGIEGQIAFGAIAAMVPLQLGQSLPAPFLLLLAIVAGAAGGMLWGLLAGCLNVFGRINEIFAGLGLNFAVDGLALYLVFGPWKRPGVASMSGTEPLPEFLWLPTIGNTDASLISISIAIIALYCTFLILRGSYFGLRLRAVGSNLRASYVLGISSIQQLLSAFAICGGLAGVAGAFQVIGVFHRLIPNISSNLGFLALLVAMLARTKVWVLLPIALFFSVLTVGSLQLPLELSLESSLSGILQGTLVLFMLLSRGLNQFFNQRGV